MKLYQLNEGFEKIATLYDNDEITLEQYEALIEELNIQITDKMDNMASYIKTLEYEANMIDEEIKALQERKKRKRNKIENLKMVLFNQFELYGMKKLETPKNNIKIKKNPPKVVIKDEESLIDELENVCLGYGLIEQKPKIDKKKLKEILQDNKLEFAEVVQDTSLSIK